MPMFASALLSRTIQPLNPKDPLPRALNLMDEFHVPILPVVAKDRLVGMLKEETALNGNAHAATVEQLMDRVELPYVRGGQHAYDVLKLMAERDLTVVPILDPGGRYLGVVNGAEMAPAMAELVNACMPGSVVVVEMARNDYSLQQLARIVEEEGARVLSMYCNDLPESMRMEVTLKINRDDISGILQAFDRFQYTVRTTFQPSRMEEDLRQRYDALIRIMKI